MSGSLSATDCTDELNGFTYYADYYQFTGIAGDKVTLQLSSSSFDLWLVLNFPSGKYTNNDNGGGGTTARIPATSGYYTLPESGTYEIEVTSYTSHSTGNYTLEFSKEASTTTLPSAPTNVTAVAGNGSATVSFTPGSIGSGTLVIYWAACGIDNTDLVIVKGSSSPITVTGLSNGTVYYCWALTEITVGYSSGWSKVSNAVTPTSSSVTAVSVVEFYNTDLDNYFITANSSEASAIDNGSAGPGWNRTGNIFSSGGNTPVCRFYGSLSPGSNSHFYTVDPGECASLKQIQASTPITKPRWNFESLDFVSTPASNGVCPGGTVPVYRAYNNGYARGVDSNHRITSNLAAIQQQVACGWSSEGVVMCAPSGTSSGGTTSCGTTGGGGGGGNSGGGGTSVVVTVSPSSSPQTVTANSVSVTIPGGLLSTPSKLTVTTPSSKVGQLPALSTDAKILRSYDISLGDLVSFGKPLILEFPYNSGDSGADEKNLWIYSLDEQKKRWMAEHGEVNTVRKVIAIKADHLSTWIESTYPDYLSVGASYNNFKVYYNPNHTQPRKDKSTGYAMRDFANDTLDALETARAGYVGADFRPPAMSTVGVVITDLPAGSEIEIHGSLLLNRPEFISLTNLREDTAHELFHIVQNRYFLTLSMLAKQWWIEGTPDYAVATFVWNNDLAKLDATYFETSLLSDDKPHAYQMPQFIRYLVNRGVGFKAIWDSVAEQEPYAPVVVAQQVVGIGNAFPAFRDYVENVTGKVFSQVWKDYVDYAMFGKSGLMADVTVSDIVLSSTATGDHKIVSVPSYAAKVVNVSIAPSALTRSIKVYAFGLASDSTVEIWQLTNRDRTTAVLRNVLVSDSDSASFDLGANVSLYTVVHNTGSVARSVTVNAESNAAIAITAISPTAGLVGAAVTISGRGFGSMEGTITFNGTPATATSWSDTSINTTVPAGATTGNVVVKNRVTAMASNGITFTVTATPGQVVSGHVEWWQGSGSSIEDMLGIKYSISGAGGLIRSPAESVKTESATYSDKLSGAALTLTGSAFSSPKWTTSDPNAFPMWLEVSVDVDGNTKSYKYSTPAGQSMSTTFNVSVPIPANAAHGSFSARGCKRSSYRDQCAGVSGSLSR